MKAAVEEFKKKFTTGFYHGSPSPNIKAFDPFHMPSEAGVSADAAGEKAANAIFLTKDPSFANSFLPSGSAQGYKPGSAVYPVSANLGKHFDYETPEGHKLINKYLETKWQIPDDASRLAEWAKHRSSHASDLKQGIWSAIEDPSFQDFLKANNYDSFALQEAGRKNVGIFEPHNIRGKFAKFNPEDADSPDFMKAEGGSVEGYAPGGKVGALVELSKLVRHPHGQDPKVAQALEEYLKGNISQADRIRIVNEQLPLRPWTELPPAYTDEQIVNALLSNKQPKALAPVPAGMRVGNRLDIPAYTQHGVYVDTTHDIAKGNSPISYGRTGHLKDVEFSSKPNQAVRVGLGTKEQALTPMGAEMGAAKSPFALIKGTNVGTSDEEVRRMMAEYLNDPNWAQIGMDPRRHSQFYDKATGLPVWSAEEKLQAGPLILAPKRGMEVTTWDDPRLNLTDFEGKKYAAGGKVGLALDLAKQIAPKFSAEAIQNMPVSSAAKQLPVAKAFQMLSAENVDPAIKSKIFKEYVSQHPGLIKKSGATNYDELTQAAYEKLLKETKDQYDLMTGAGVKVDWDPTGAKGYKNSAEMLKDAAENKHLTVFQGGEPHPLLPGQANEQFRAVHDYFGHGTTGSSFGPKGEELAYGAHSQMYSPLARLAAAAETRGQNSFVNYSGINEDLIKKMNEARARGASPEELQQLGQQWQYAPQKGLILPPEQVDINYKGYAAGGSVAKKALEFAKSIPFVHFSKADNIARLEPNMYGTGIKGAEGSRLQDAADIRPRSYFYTDRPDVRPEQGLGNIKYSGVSEASYPLHEDPAGFYKLAKELAKDPFFAKQNVEIIDRSKMLNEVERAIKNAGYTGYHTDEAGILFHPTDVKKVTE